MSKLLLQHWHDANLPESVRESSENMRAYANRMGADYRMLTGFPLDPRLTAPCQKVYMLWPEFDAYDVVCMVDADMFAAKGLGEDVFERTGVGWYHDGSHPRACRKNPKLTSMKAPFWGGAIYVTRRALRERLRDEYDFAEAVEFNDRGRTEDEGIMHRLAMRAGLEHGPLWYFDKRWCYGNCEPNPGQAAFIHVRQRPGTRVENIAELRRRGLIA